MKKYRLKINFYYAIQLQKGLLFEYDKVTNLYYCKNSEINFLSVSIVENNPDIFELIKEEPQEEVIEGYAEEGNEALIFVKKGYYRFNLKEAGKTPARLILNPKPKKEYVRWVMKEFIDNLENNYPIYRVLSTESDYEKYCHKIKIIVEE